MFARRRLLHLFGLGTLAALSSGAVTGCQRGQLFAFYNWGDYLAPGLLERFAEREAKAGHAAVRPVQDYFLSELELLNKLRAGDRHDVVVPIDYLMTRMARERLLHALDLAALPGIQHLDPAYPPWRPPAKYLDEAGDQPLGIPYFWGVTGIGYDSAKVDPPTSWEALFDPRYAGRISVLDSKGDVFDQAQMAAGLGINSTDKKSIREIVYPKLVAQKKLLRAYDGNPERALAAGETYLAQIDSGDLMRAQRQRPSLRFVVPKEGAPYWVDYLAVPKAVSDLPRAHRFIEFLLDPEIAAQNANYLRFATPNRSALDRGLIADAHDPGIYPPAEREAVHPRSENWDGKTKALVEKLWIELRAN
ncbi:MAG TPA: spermidine/putrescine ABC transporter substrate-binding protein [Nannocystis exedens]|nr:spermidine/putrescine ABC transporter substrate-binding protein [Nannocystis exedens]